MIFYIFQDWKSNKGNTKGRIIALAYRTANYSTKNIIWKFLLTPYRIFYKITFEWFLGVEIPYTTKIGKGFVVYHFQSVVINEATIIGENVILRHCTTIGNNGKDKKCPVLGNGINIGANVCIIGAITIGDNIDIGAGAVVTKSFPSNCVIAGNPARVIRQK